MVISPGIADGLQIYRIVIPELAFLYTMIFIESYCLSSLLRRNATNLHLLFLRIPPVYLR